MLSRRLLLGALGGATLTPLAGPFLGAHAASGSYEDFLAGLREEAHQAGISRLTISRSLSNLRPLDRVLQLDRRQPEFTLTWEQYRDRQLVPQRIDKGRQLAADNRQLLEQIGIRYRVSPRVIMAIWGMETNYGAFTGSFFVIEALATLAWDGRRSAYFRQELIAALRILDEGHVTPERMKGSWAGAMGQPQFMPSNFSKLAVDFDGDGRRDIWDDRGDALASIANYLSNSGWREQEPWGREVMLPAGFDPALASLDVKRPLRDWVAMGVQTNDGTSLQGLDMEASILQPSGAGGQAFAVHANFAAIRRYNPSTYYALAVAMLSDRVA
ncbi:lytic murein transglycosylase [Acetobacteraceae bacterium H6797]|nr:lytic murein transglycosylase [Acetobacteraceae bacterium H6797]